MGYSVGSYNLYISMREKEMLRGDRYASKNMTMIRKYIYFWNVYYSSTVDRGDDLS